MLPIEGRRDAKLVIDGRRDVILVIEGRRDGTLVIEEALCDDRLNRRSFMRLSGTAVPSGSWTMPIALSRHRSETLLLRTLSGLDSSLEAMEGRERRKCPVLSPRSSSRSALVLEPPLDMELDRDRVGEDVQLCGMDRLKCRPMAAAESLALLTSTVEDRPGGGMLRFLACLTWLLRKPSIRACSRCALGTGGTSGLDFGMACGILEAICRARWKFLS